MQHKTLHKIHFTELFSHFCLPFLFVNAFKLYYYASSTQMHTSVHGHPTTHFYWSNVLMMVPPYPDRLQTDKITITHFWENRRF